MTFDEWWENWVTDALGHGAQHPTAEQKQSADDAFHWQQQEIQRLKNEVAAVNYEKKILGEALTAKQRLIDEHNRAMDAECEKPDKDFECRRRLYSTRPLGMCEQCPRRHKIEE